MALHAHIGLSATAFTLVISLAATAQEPPLVGDLKVPRGLSLADGALLIAEQGAGRILSLDAEGVATTVAGGLVTGEFVSPEGPTSVGISSVIKVDETYFFVVGGSLGNVPGSGAVYSVTDGGTPKLISDLWAYEQANNTGNDETPTGEPDIDSNPCDLVSDGADGLFVSDAGANAVFHVGPDDTTTLFAQFPDRENPLVGTLGGPLFDQVPTGLATGPDDAVYVSTLTGFPFIKEAARVNRLADGNSDGDALDEGETTVFAEGLTTATDLAFAPDGTLYITEFSTDMLNQAPGRLVKVEDGELSEVATGLISPTSLAVLPDGRIAVTQEFPGIVTAAGQE